MTPPFKDNSVTFRGPPIGPHLRQCAERQMAVSEVICGRGRKQMRGCQTCGPHR